MVKFTRNVVGVVVRCVYVCCFILFLLWRITGMLNGERNLEETIDVTQDQDVQLKCRFSPELAKKSSTLFWIRTNREGHDNVAIDETPFQVGYR